MRGFFWVAGDHRGAYEWAQAGGVSNVISAGFWWTAGGKAGPRRIRIRSR
ncbi:MAG: GTP-binding protein [Myxococcota bacterium]